MGTSSSSEAVAVTARAAAMPSSVVVCSLEPWGTVRRRLRILVEELVALDDALHVLYVAPAVDVPHELRHGRLAALRAPRLERVHPRITVLRPRKLLPRALGPHADRALERQVLVAAHGLEMEHPLLWINDSDYAHLLVATGWHALYDVTDDWLLAPASARRHARLLADEALLLDRADAVVVCSEALAHSRGATRAVEVIPNGVDVELFRAPQARPHDLPAPPTAVYVGTLHEERVDVDLVCALAAADPALQVVLVGPNSLRPETTGRLDRLPNVHLLGPRPYETVPAYFRHADVVIVPHQVNPFTESLDPIKAYECLAAGRPTVATPVAGFRQLGSPVVVAEPERFVEAVLAARTGGAPAAIAPDDLPSWRRRAEAMATAMAGAWSGKSRP